MYRLSINFHIVRCNVFGLTLKLLMDSNVKLRIPAITCYEESDDIDGRKKSMTSDRIFFPNV